MAKTSNQILLDTVNAANGTMLTLNDVSIHPQSTSPTGDAVTVLRQQQLLSEQPQEVSLTYKKINITTVFAQPPEGYIPSQAQTMKALMYELNERFGTQFNGSDLLLNGRMVSNVFVSEVAPTYVTEVEITCTESCASYYGTIVLLFKTPGPLLYGADRGWIESDPVQKRLDEWVNTGPSMENNYIKGDGKKLYASLISSEMYHDWTINGNDIGQSVICPQELPPEYAGTRIVIDTIPCYLNRTFLVKWLTPPTSDGGDMFMCIYFFVSLSFAPGTTAAAKLQVKNKLKELYEPQGMLYLEIVSQGVVIGSMTGYRTKNSMAGDPNPELNDDSVLFFQMDYQPDMIAEDMISMEGILENMNDMSAFRLRGARKYHMTDRTSRIPMDLLPAELEAYPVDYSAVEPPTASIMRSVVNRDVIRTSFGKGEGYEYPVDYLQGRVPNMQTGAGWLAPHSGVSHPPLSAITFPGNTTFRAGWVHYGEWNNRSNRQLIVALTLASDTEWSMLTNSQPIRDAWNAVVDDLKLAAGWNPDIGPVCFLQHVPEGDLSQNQICTIKTLFMPQIIGNAVIFTGVRDYGNRPGTRCYTPLPNCVAIGNGSYYPN